ncbi:thioesterase domain-containing protein, partial [Sphingomonas sanguinis]|uniref:thioesterase domain-containing protein n=1 Tax=Sphingomonas sanguinis TaxID=33051 RepID=UPI000A5DB9A4
LFARPVLADLAAEVTSNADHDHGAVPIRVTGTRPPLFVTPAGSGDYSYAARLAEGINNENAIYALPWPLFSPGTTLLEIATLTAETIKRVQPIGPYQLIGYSSGGILTYAIAHHLETLGEEVAFLGLIDTPSPSLSDADPSAWLNPRRLLIDAISLRSHASMTNKKDDVECEETLEHLVRKAIEIDLIQGFDEQGWITHCAFEWAARSYVPPKIDTWINQFNASIAESDTNGGKRRSEFLGWENAVPSSQIVIHDIPGDHGSMMEDDSNREVLAKTISQCLSKRM